MNLFLDYQKKIFNSLKVLSKKKIIKIPNSVKNITVELPPKNQIADISCNVAMILAKYNNKKPVDIANILREQFLKNFKEFEKIDIANPGFINITFKIFCIFTAV